MPSTSVDPGMMPRTDAEREAIRGLLQQMRKSGPAPAPAPRKQEREEEISTPAAARITVKLPADARLWVDQVECPLTSAERAFNTPALQPGQSYFYTLKVQVQRNGTPVTDSQRVVMRAGQHVTVDFAGAESFTTAQR
jgi:uncharacterized protein (TIGR03000 family)